MWKRLEAAKRKAAKAIIELLERAPDMEVGVRIGAAEFYVRVYRLYRLLKSKEKRTQDE